MNVGQDMPCDLHELGQWHTQRRFSAAEIGHGFYPLYIIRWNPQQYRRCRRSYHLHS